MGRISQAHRQEQFGLDSSGRPVPAGTGFTPIAQAAFIAQAVGEALGVPLGGYPAVIAITGEWVGTETIEVDFTTGVETTADGTVTLDTGASGSVDGIEVDSIEIMSGVEAFDTDLTDTATAVAANITAHTSSPNYNATSVGAVITITSVETGYPVNGLVVVSSVTTITTTDVNMAGALRGPQTTGPLDMGNFATGTVTLDSGASGSVDSITVDDVEVMSGATGTVTLDTGASGSVDGIEVDSIEIMSGAESFVSDLPTTATAVAANITANTSSPDYNAVAVGAVITITAVLDGGAANGLTVVTSVTTITVTDTNMIGEAFDTDLPDTATAVANNINANTSSPNYTAAAVGAVVTITALVGGESVNGFVVVSSETTIVATDTNMAGGDGRSAEEAAMVVAAALDALIDTQAVRAGSRVEVTPTDPAVILTLDTVTIA